MTRLLMLRHGESLANVEGLVVSLPRNGISRFGLSPEGHRQAKALADEVALYASGPKIEAIYASDFLRTRQTAEHVASRLGLEVSFDSMLRERQFGDFEMASKEAYSKVWEEDAKDPKHRRWGVESVTEVAERMLGQVEIFSKRHPQGDVLIVSHGDSLQILLTVLEGRPANEHRRRPDIKTCELIQFDLNPSDK